MRADVPRSAVCHLYIADSLSTSKNCSILSTLVRLVTVDRIANLHSYAVSQTCSNWVLQDLLDHLVRHDIWSQKPDSKMT
jgi:hypothetical protein